MCNLTLEISVSLLLPLRNICATIKKNCYSQMSHFVYFLIQNDFILLESFQGSRFRCEKNISDGSEMREKVK